VELIPNQVLSLERILVPIQVFAIGRIESQSPSEDQVNVSSSLLNLEFLQHYRVNQILQYNRTDDDASVSCFRNIPNRGSARDDDHDHQIR